MFLIGLILLLLGHVFWGLLLMWWALDRIAEPTSSPRPQDRTAVEEDAAARLQAQRARKAKADGRQCVVLGLVAGGITAVLLGVHELDLPAGESSPGIVVFCAVLAAALFLYAAYLGKPLPAPKRPTYE